MGSYFSAANSTTTHNEAEYAARRAAREQLFAAMEQPRSPTIDIKEPRIDMDHVIIAGFVRSIQKQLMADSLTVPVSIHPLLFAY